MNQCIADAVDRLEASMENYDASKLNFPGGSVIVPQPTRVDLLISAEEWSKTARSAIIAFADLAEAGDRKGCQMAIKSFMASAQMVADRMLEACP